MIDKIKFLIRELIKTFSKNDDSYFSRKKIEIFILFINSIILLNVYFFYNLNSFTVDNVDAFMLIFVSLMVYAGWNNIHLFNIRKYFNEINKNQNEVSDKDKTQDSSDNGGDDLIKS